MKQIYILFTLLYFFHLTAMSQESSRPFITTWETTSTSRTITIPTTGGGYDYSVDWGDGTAESGFSGDATHTYAEAGTYTVSISGDFPRIFFNNTRLDINLSRTLIRSIDQWGDQQWNSFASAFAGCSNLVYNATDTPDLSNVEDMSSAFEGASRFNGNIDDWDVSKVTDMSSMFKDASSFNQPLNNWNVGNVTDMSRMFADAVVFNQPLNDWDVSSVTNMETILGTLSNFTRTMAFNQDISNWNVTNVTDMSGMFRGARSFNSDIGNWDVSNVTNMSGMFGQAFSFNADISSWDVSNVTNMSGMFREAISFNSDIGNWDVSNVTNMGGMFLGRLLGSPNMIFNHDLNKWDVGNVTNMAGMFQNNPTYNRNLSDWDVSNVTNMRSMFDFASRFNGDISTWNVSNVTNMNRMFFLARRFNNDVSSWDVSKVTDMTNMFGSATDFNQNLEHWNIVNAASSSNLSGFLIGTRISTTNYDATLIGWSQLSDLPKGRTLGASARYCDDSGRAKLIEEFNWTINDAGKGTNCPPSITFEPLADVTFGDERFELVASTTSELPITYTSSDETVATIDGNIVSILAAGTTTITATQSGNENFEAAEAEQVLTVNNASQSISFEPLAAVTFGDEDFEFVASTTSELPITYTSSDETVATIDGNIVSILAAGTTTITATQSGNENSEAAEPVSQVLVVNSVLSIDPLKEQLSLQLYPNPSKKVVHLKSEGQIQQVRLYTLSGILLNTFQFNDTQASIDLSDRPAGVYMIRVNEGSKTYRLIKQ